jgi:hypothetical protein
MNETVQSRVRMAAFGLALVMLLVSMALRPLWRDEFWALYFSEPGYSISSLVFEKVTGREHPPFYFLALYAWRHVFDTDLWARLLNLGFLLAAGWAIWRLGRARERETGLFLLAAATSYWALFYGVEIRMYALMFATSAAMIYIVARALDRPSWLLAAAFALVGFGGAFSHFFSALWAAVLGGFTVLVFLHRRDWTSVVAWSLATAAAIGPAAAWAIAFRPEGTSGVATTREPFVSALGYASNQFLRGLVVKTFGSNLVLFVVAFLGAGALCRRRSAADAVVAAAVLATVAAVYAIHLFYVPLIKERAFIVVFAGVIFLAVRAVAARAEAGRPSWLARWIPLAALISPLLFVPEYFKDREEIGRARQVIAASGECGGAAIPVYYRPSGEEADWPAYVVARTFKGAARGRDLALLDLGAISAPPTPKPGCALRAIAPLLSRGERAMHADVRAALSAKGFDLDALEEVRLGDGRTLLYRSRPHEP